MTSNGKCEHAEKLEAVKDFVRPDKPHGCTFERSLETHEKSPQ